MSTITVLTPAGLTEMQLPISGKVYPSGGRVDIDQLDLAEAISAGCRVPGASNFDRRIIGSATVKMTDANTAIPILDAAKYRFVGAFATNAVGTVTPATGGLFTDSNSSGDTLVAAAQTFTDLTSASVVEDLSVNTGADKKIETAQTLYFCACTATGATGHADFYLLGDVIK